MIREHNIGNIMVKGADFNLLEMSAFVRSILIGDVFGRGNISFQAEHITDQNRPHEGGHFKKVEIRPFDHDITDIMLSDQRKVFVDIISRHEDKFNFRIPLPGNAEQLDTIHKRHADIGDDYLWRALGNEFFTRRMQELYLSLGKVVATLGQELAARRRSRSCGGSASIRGRGARGPGGRQAYRSTSLDAPAGTEEGETLGARLGEEDASLEDAESRATLSRSLGNSASVNALSSI